MNDRVATLRIADRFQDCPDALELGVRTLTPARRRARGVALASDESVERFGGALVEFEIGLG